MTAVALAVVGVGPGLFIFLTLTLTLTQVQPLAARLGYPHLALLPGAVRLGLGSGLTYP